MHALRPRMSAEDSAHVRPEATVEKARRGLAAARAEYIPEIGVFALHAYQSGIPFLPTNNVAVGARMSWELFDGGKRKAQVGERRSQVEQAEENLRRVRNRVRLDVEKGSRKVERLEDLVRVAERAVIVRKEARRIAADAVELGAATSLALKQAEAGLADADAQLLEARIGLRLAQAEVERAVGR